jgi:dTDP-4-dehydrorhamnose reductase
MRVLVTGCNGQLGREIRELREKYPMYRFTFTDVDELNIGNREEVLAFVSELRPVYIINCAGYTAVDKAESEPEMAHRINATAVANLAEAALSVNAFIVHISTDYIFDGHGYRPYTEEDAPSPLSVYGESKLAGEYELLTSAARGMILRTSWLYSEFGANFVKTMMRFGAEKGHLRVVSDQVGTPTYAADLAEVILGILPKTDTIKGTEIFNYANHGVTSWYDFALAVIGFSGISCRVEPITTAEYPTAAIRPFYSVLSKEKITKAFGLEIPHWRDSLARCIQRIQSN